MQSLFRKMVGAPAAPIGIDCGTRQFKAVQLRPLGGSFEVVAAAGSPVADGVWDDPQELARYFRRDVRAILGRGGFRGRQVALALPAHHLFVGSVRKDHARPGTAGEDLEDPLPEWVPLRASEALVRHVEAGDVYDGGERRREVVTLAVARQVVDAYLAAASGAGLEVVSVTAEPVALLAALALGGADSRTMRLVVDLGLTSTRVYAGIGRRLVFARRLRTGGRNLERAVRSALGVGADESCSLRAQLPPLDHADTVPDARLRRVDEVCQEAVFRLVTEIRTCLEYVASVFGNTPVHHIEFVGGGAKYRRLCQRVAHGVGVSARVADPLGRLYARAGAGRGKAAPNDGPAWAAAVGLCIEGAAAAAGEPADAGLADDGVIALAV
jgi:type IV pilus assembly protein PilM